MLRGWRRWCLALGLAVGVAASLTGSAAAHAWLVRASPVDGAVLAELPAQAHLWFDEAIAVPLCTAQLLDAAGQPVGTVTVQANPADPGELVVNLPAVGSGLYSLNWKIVSALDTHRTQGTLVYGVNQAVEASASASPAPPPPWPEVALSAAAFVSYALGLGGLFTANRVLVSRPSDLELYLAPARRQALRIAQWASLGLIGVGALSLAWQIGTLDTVPLAVLLRTRFGALWLAQELLAVILGLAAAAQERQLGWGGGSAALAAGGLAVAQALNSHAAAGGLIAVTMQAVHLLAACGWVGAVVILALLLGSGWRYASNLARQAGRAALAAFGRWAFVGVGIVIATGLYNTGRQVVSLDAWVLSPYGQALAAKILVFVSMGLTGLMNASLLHPRVAAGLARLLRRPAGWTVVGQDQLPRVLWMEAVVGVAILVVTGGLTALPPARGTDFIEAPHPTAALTSLAQSAADLTVNLQIRPNKPGPNLITVGVFNTRRPAPAAILRVLVRLTYLDQDLGSQTLTAEALPTLDEYGLDTPAFSLAGHWRVRVIVRRSGLEDATADFDWTVDALPPAAPRPVLISHAPLAPWLNGMAVGLLGLTLWAVIAMGRVRSDSTIE